MVSFPPLFSFSSKTDIWFGLILPYSLIIIEQTFEVVMYDSPPWRLLGKEIFGLLVT
jgi:hypothetical protein